MTAKGEVKGNGKANSRRRKIQISGKTADLLEARAVALGVSVADLMAAIVDTRPAAPQQAGNANAEAVAAPSDARWRDVKAWIDSWGKANELPRPKLGK